MAAFIGVQFGCLSLPYIMVLTGFIPLLFFIFFMTDVPTFNCFSSRVERKDTSVDFSILSYVSLSCPHHCLSSFLSSFLLQWVVSFPHDQHFCCLCFLLYLRSPSFLSSLSHSCMREQLCPVVGMFRWVSNSRVSFYSLLSSTMGLNVCCRMHTLICQVIWFLRSQ